MLLAWFICAALQGLILTWDEFAYHRKRGLGLWEQWGHPIDTAMFALPIGLSAFGDFSPQTQTLYIVLAIASCLIITKDEWVHARECEGGEQWLHALLFILHPLVLGAGYALWLSQQTLVLKIQCLLVVLFGFFQLLTWPMGDKLGFYRRHSASSSPKGSTSDRSP